MNTFVILFRQGPRPLTDTDKQRRSEEVAIWARRQNEAGHKLAPHILAPESVKRGPDVPIAAHGEWPVTALLLVEARDLDEAATVAESHPALRFGASVEVRAWSRPPGSVPPQVAQ